VRHLRLQSAMKNGEPVDVAVDIPVDFRLDDPRENHPLSTRFHQTAACASVKPPQPVLRIQPEYTEIAKRDGVAGVVSLDVVVRKDGTVDVSRVAESLDHALDRAAVDALSRWVFTPRICDGAPLETPLKLDVNFNLR
jgi:TonB family protein